MHDFDVHEALYKNYEVCGPWIRVLKLQTLGQGQYDHLEKMY